MSANQRFATTRVRRLLLPFLSLTFSLSANTSLQSFGYKFTYFKAAASIMSLKIRNKGFGSGRTSSPNQSV